MLQRFTHEIFKRRKFIILIFLVVLGYGIYSYKFIPKQEMPEFDTPFMVTSITAPSMSATDIETEIVDDIEKLIMTYSDVTEVRSFIYDNYAVIYTTFSFGVDDPDQLSKTIFEHINNLSLSSNITDIQYTSNYDDPHIIYALHSVTLTETELLHLADEFKNELLLIEEVGHIEIDSVFNKEVVITLDKDLLNTYGLSITDIYSILYANTLNIPLGGINTMFGTISISGNIDIDDISDLENVIIIPEIPSITPQVKLEDIATIQLLDTSTKTYEFNDEKAVFLSVYFDSSIDFTKMGETVTETKNSFMYEEIGEYEISEMLFLPDYVNKQINDVFYSLLLAILIVMIVVLIGIGFRNSMMVVLTIPIIIFGTVGILYVAGYELHKLTIVGLIVAIGILVDNQIVITEGIKRNVDMGMEKVYAAKKAVIDNFEPVLSSTLTTIAAFLVIVLLPGFLGKMVSSMPLTVIIAIGLSFIISMTLSPIIAAIFLKQNKLIQKETIHSKRIKKMIRGTIAYPWVWILISVVTFFGVAYLAFYNQPVDIYPNDERSVLYIDFEDERFLYVDSIKEDIIEVITEHPDYINHAVSIGGDLPTFHFSAKLINEQPHFGRIYINMNMTETELLQYKEDLELALSEIDFTKITVNTLELSPPVAPVRMFIQSDNPEQLDSFSEIIINDIDSLESVKTYQTTTNTKASKLYIHYDFFEIRNHYLTKAQIDSMISLNLNGYELEIFEYNSELINVDIRTNISTYQDILELQIYSEQLEEYYPLSDFISITPYEDYVVINHLNNKGVTIIDLYPVKGTDNFSLQDDLEEIISVYPHENITVSYGGENDMFLEISEDLLRASIIAIVLIFIIMMFQFNNFIKPLIVFVTIPLSFTGSFLFLIIFNESITATALVGMVSLLGVTVNTGILLVEYIKRHHTYGVDIKDACVDAVYLRFRPIMLTSITTILGLIPLLITGGNFFRPLAITFMGGLVTSTLITIFLVPSLYYLIYKNKKIVSE